MLSRCQFEVLKSCALGKDIDVLASAVKQGYTRTEAEAVLCHLKGVGLIGSDGSLTHMGMVALSPYKVDSAVILAAGMATRFAPLSFEKPKAMFEVRGEILIERAIRQLQAVGIGNITIVVGYMKESFFYLEDEFGVHVVVNSDFATRNNHSSLWQAKELLANTYVLSSDQYYVDNVFSLYNYMSYSSAVFIEGRTDEQVLSFDEAGIVNGLARGGENACIALGPAYLDREFSKQYLEILEREYDLPQTMGKLWEELYAEHVCELPMEARVFDAGVIFEFDYLTDLVAFDADFFVNVDSRILDNICVTLACERDDISDVKPIKAGLSNLSTLFSVGETEYIYRHPGAGTEDVVNREAEARALVIAGKLNLDDTYIFENPKEGWKISHYIKGCVDFDYHDQGQVREALGLIRRLHESGETLPWHFDFYEEGLRLIGLLDGMNYPLPRDFNELARRVCVIADLMKGDAGKPVLCHNDFYGPNLLVAPDRMRLIDWEYAAMGDPACDLGNFVSQGSGYSVKETLDMLPLYFGRPATFDEERHCLAAVGLVGWYWYVWALYKEAVDNPVGEWTRIWYQAAKLYTKAAEERYGILADK